MAQDMSDYVYKHIKCHTTTKHYRYGSSVVTEVSSRCCRLMPATLISKTTCQFAPVSKAAVMSPVVVTIERFHDVYLLSTLVLLYLFQADPSRCFQSGLFKILFSVGQSTT